MTCRKSANCCEKRNATWCAPLSEASLALPKQRRKRPLQHHIHEPLRQHQLTGLLALISKT